jgi:hypothetical protein
MGEDSPIAPRKKTPRIWHSQHEAVLKTWGEAAACYRYMHFKAYQMFKAMNMSFMLPIIVISTITGTANFAQQTFPESIRQYIPAIIGAMNLLTAILTTIVQFMKIPELMESHRVSYINYGKLARTVRLELTLPISERFHHGGNMVDISGVEYDRLIEQSPPVPHAIIRNFKRKFPEGKLTVMGLKFSRPEIMSIKPIDTYDSVRETHMTETVADKFKSNLFKSRRKSETKPPLLPSVIMGSNATLANIKDSVIQELRSLRGKTLVSAPKQQQPHTPDEIVVEIFEDAKGDDEAPEHANTVPEEIATHAVSPETLKMLDEIDEAEKNMSRTNMCF